MLIPKQNIKTKSWLKRQLVINFNWYVGHFVVNKSTQIQIDWLCVEEKDSQLED